MAIHESREPVVDIESARDVLGEAPQHRDDKRQDAIANPR